MKKKKDILFEEDILKMLAPILEQEPGTAEPSPSGAPTPSTTPAQAAAAGGPQQPALPAPQTPQQKGTEVTQYQQETPETQVQYYSTKDLFTTAPPPNSSDWPAEMKSKTWMIPLQDGRVAQKLMKMFPTFKQDGRGHGAARYSDNQFRVVLRGDLKAEAELVAKGSTKTPGRTSVELVSVEIPNKGNNLVPTGTNPQSVENMKGKGSIELKMPTEAIVKWATGVSTKEQVEKSKERVEDLMDQLYDQASGDTKDRFDRGDLKIKAIEDSVKKDIEDNKIQDRDGSEVYKELWKKWRKLTGEVDKPDIKISDEEPSEAPSEKPGEKKKIKVEEHPSYDKFMETATGESLGMKQKEAENYLDWLIKTKKPTLKAMGDAEAAKFVLSNLQAYKDRNKQESINLNEYLKKLLLEQDDKASGKHSKKELESKEGGELIATLNDQIFKQWFAKKGAGIAAPTNNRLFEGNMFEWFAVSAATFKPTSRKSKGTGGDAEITFKGDITMQSEIWIDARVQPLAGSSKWSFRVWDKNSPVLTSSFRIPVTVKRIASGIKRGAVDPARLASAKKSSEKEAAQGDTI